MNTVYKLWLGQSPLGKSAGFSKAQGKGIKSIAKTLLINKNMVKGYVRKAKMSNLSIEAILAIEDPVLEGNLWPGNPAYKDEKQVGCTKYLSGFGAKYRNVQ